MNYSPAFVASKTPEELARSISIDHDDGTREYLFIPSDLQAEIMAATEPNLFVWGNRGGGKSVAMRWLCHSMALAIPGFKYAILRSSFPELQKNHLIFLDAEMAKFGDNQESFYHKTEHACYYPNGSMGFYAQCEHDKDVDNVIGAEVALIVFDEAPTFQWEHMRLIGASLRVAVGSGIQPMVRYLGNPVGQSIDELWKYFIDKDVTEEEDPEYRPEDFRAIEIRLQDNPHLDEKQYRKQFAGLPEHYRKAWLDGVRVEERTLFSFYPSKTIRHPDTKEVLRTIEHYHVVDELPIMSDGTPLIRTLPNEGGGRRYEIPSWVKVYRAYDHGFFPDAAVCEWFAVVGRRIFCFKEKVWYRTIAEDIAKDIVAESIGMNVVTTYCDPSIDIKTGADVFSIRQKMENEGLPLDPSVNNREFFASSIHSLLQEEVEVDTPRIQLYRRGCPYLIKYLPRMKWDEHKPNALADHKHDHPVVTLAYFAMSFIPSTSESAPKVAKPWMKPKKGTRRVLGRDNVRLGTHRLR